MARMIVGYIVVFLWNTQTKSYHGPFFTADRAKKYADSGNVSDEIIEYTIEPLVIPHHLMLEATER